MEDRALLLVALAVLASGCVHPEGGGPGVGPSGNEGKGLEIKELSIADPKLSPGQQTIVRLRLKNYHTEPIEIQDISLYNTAFLEASGKSCSPSQISQSRKDFAPEMECSWNLKAPDDIQGFESKTVTMKLNLRYRSSLSNEKQPLKIQFRPLEDIEKREKAGHRFSNGETVARVSYENPVPMKGGVVSFELGSAGPGRVDSDYTIEYRPSSVFSDCPGKVRPVSTGEARFSCEMSSGSEAVRNLVFSTSYKYVKSPSLDVGVVRP